MKYTQGKWNTFFTADDDETEFAITANGTVICINGERNNEVNFANANLIASAPEMLELLKKCYTGEIEEPYNNDELNAFISKAEVK